MEKKIDLDSLNTLKRQELQKLAKKYGIKANLRNAKLIEEIGLKLKENKSEQESCPTPKISVPKKNKSLSPNLANLSSDLVSLDSISPLCKSESSDILSNVPNKATPLNSRRSKTRSRNNIDSIPRTRSSSRTKVEKKTPIASTKPQQPPKPTPDHTRKPVNTRTFSIPKNRSCPRVDPKTKSKAQATKRKRSDANQKLIVSKRGRKTIRSDKTDGDSREAVLSLIEKKVGHKSELRAFDKKFGAFAVEGMTVSTSLPTPSNYKFGKAHTKTFKSMESIEDYQKRKQQRAEKLLGSNKKQNRLEALAKPKTPSIVKPVTKPKPTFFSPKSKPIPSSSKSVKNLSSVFKPSATKLTDINTNFVAKKSKLVTPRKVAVSFAKSPTKPPERTPARNKKTPAAQRRSSTPFRQNTALLNTPQSAKKNTFDLQESLKKPITWKPHKGPLKKFEDTNKKPSFKDRVKSYKQPKAATRESRRMKAQESRQESKSDRLMKRRGIK